MTGAGALDCDAVVFDLYGTLLEVSSVAPACAEVTGEPERLVELWRQRQLEYTWLRSLMGRHEDFWTVTADALDHALERLGIRADGPTRRRLMEAWLEVRPYPEVAAALAALAPRPLVVLSNGTPTMLEEALGRSGLRGHFAHVLSVEAVGVFKPSPLVYEVAERTLGASRERVLFVSSNAWDAAGAKSFGLTVAWVNRRGAPRERLGVVPDVVVADLADLASLTS